MKSLAKENYKPHRGITFLDEKSCRDISPEEVSPQLVGWKAYGLTILPANWVPPFVAVDGNILSQPISASQDRLSEILLRIGIQPSSAVIVRSSGTEETLDQTGQLESESCRADEVIIKIRDLTSRISSKLVGKLHWVVQQFIDVNEKGHLSNERRLKRESRDWVLEYEVKLNSLRKIGSIAVRRWRDGMVIDEDELICPLTFNIPAVLERVAKWGMQFDRRIHVEWVWDGKKIFVVQVQPEIETDGQKPHTLLPKKLPEFQTPALEVFRVANDKDFQKYKKLHNVDVYTKVGYEMPPFYVLDDLEVIRLLLKGQVADSVRPDLDSLTKRPLVIRTDGTDIPGNKREMLPRSEGLDSTENVVHWFSTTLSSQLIENGLEECSLCLIAHSFIPSVAAAWASAIPGHRYVRIESLWGVPEGLYWCSHDTFEVDTLTSQLNPVKNLSNADFKLREYTRFKGSFIAPNSEGKWIPFQPSRPHQWGSSVKRDNLFEIAYSTRKISEQEKRSVAVMWFIDNHPDATSHKVLPWYHQDCDLKRAKKAAPRHKYRGASEVEIATPDGWTSLQKRLSDPSNKIDRVIVNPTDPELVRNPKFARDLGSLAVQHDFVVELSGGLPSHAYYMLKKSGAKVECVDLFAVEDEEIEYNKIVRDKIPENILRHGEDVQTVKLGGEALVVALQRKLVEEALELRDLPSGSDLLSELVDVEEVVSALCAVLGISESDMKKARADKVAKRGSFDEGLLLVKTSTSHTSTASKEPTRLLSNLAEDLEVGPLIIDDPKSIPSTKIYRRPDLRNLGDNQEKILTFEFDFNEHSNVKEELPLRLLLNGEQHTFTVELNLSRNRAKIREVIRVRKMSVQPSLHFDDSDDGLRIE